MTNKKIKVGNVEIVAVSDGVQYPSRSLEEIFPSDAPVDWASTTSAIRKRSASGASGARNLDATC